jgi:hypothetical protein
VSVATYIVWVGGVDDEYATEAAAEQAAATWRDRGYDDVIIQTVRTLETVTCSECGRVGSEACWVMATPLCPECFVGSVE